MENQIEAVVIKAVKVLTGTRRVRKRAWQPARYSENRVLSENVSRTLQDQKEA